MTKKDSSSNGAPCLELHSTWGVIRLSVAQGEVVSCSLPRLRAEPRESFVWRNTNLNATDSADIRVLRESERFLRRTLEGKKSKTPKFQWPKATPFTARVWKALLDIPRGETVEYGELARLIGRPGGARAVGRACGSNPLPLFIPCHRVLPKDGSLGGFSSGLPWKRLLLEREGRL